MGVLLLCGLLGSTAPAWAQMATGSYVGSGNDDTAITGLGFQPDFVVIKGDLAQPSVFRTSTMPGDMTKSYEGASAVRLNLIQSLDPDGFTLGDDAAVNSAGVIYQWIAFLADPEIMAVGAYLGDGQPVNIVGTEFFPDYVLVTAESSAKPWQRFGGMPTDQSLPFDDGLPGANLIQQFRVDGFKIGTDPQVNTVDWAFHWVAFKAEPGHLQIGSYLGDGQDDRAVSGLIQEPEYLILATDGPHATPHRTTDLGPGDLAMHFDSRGHGPNEIQALRETEFEIGSETGVNADGALYYWAAFGSGLNGTDLALTLTGDPDMAAVGDTITYTVKLENLVGLDATGVAVCDTLPTELAFIDAVATVGTYDPGTHLWDIGNLILGDTATLTLRTVLNSGGPLLISNTAAVCALDQADLNPLNNVETSEINLVSPTVLDLVLSLAPGDTLINFGDTVPLTLSLSNTSPTSATGITVSVPINPALGFVSATPTRGTFNAVTGDWDIDQLDDGELETLDLILSVTGGAPGDTLFTSASVSALDQLDSDPANNTARLSVRLTAADLRVHKTVSNSQPHRDETVTYQVIVENLGPDQASGIVLTDAWPADLVMGSASAGSGLFNPGDGTWTLPLLAPDQADTLTLSATIDSLLSNPDVTNTVAVTAVEQGDPVPANNVASVALTIAPPSGLAVTALPFAQDTRQLLPGTPSDDILTLNLVNNGTRRETLLGLSLTNLVADPERQDIQDAAWAAMELVMDVGAEESPDKTRITTLPQTFTDGRLTFSDLFVVLEPGDSQNLTVRGTVSLQARDGEELQIALGGPEDLIFANDIHLDGAWPLISNGTLLVDGMTAGQIQLHPVEPAVFQIGSTRNLALDFTVPANGYQTDTLTKLNVVNFGNATPLTEITNMEAWVDDGDGLLNLLSDQQLCTLYSTGGRWEYTGLNQPVPLDGLRLFVTVDINEMAYAGSVRLGLPGPDDFGLGMASGNDGPVDTNLINDFTQSISATDRLILSTSPLPEAPVAPGDNLTLLHLVTQNIYTETQTLRRLTVQNTSLGAAGATGGAMDGLVSQLFLHIDGDGDGELGNKGTDPILGTAIFTNGVAVFDGLTWDIAADETRHLFVAGDLSLHGAADGDRVSTAISGAADVSFTAPVSLVANWPLQGTTGHLVNGMVSAQITVRPVPAVTIAPTEGPILALDLTIPANGALADTFSHLEITNLATATAADFDAVELWQDAGLPGFDPLEDINLGTLVDIAGRWRIQDLGRPIPVGGLDLFVSLRVGLTPANGATVQLAVPLNGVSVASENDGPLDAAVPSPTTLLLSTAPLISDLEWSTDRSVENQNTTLLMIVRNRGGETINGITPSDLVFSGPGRASIVGTFKPGSIDLLPTLVDTFIWTCSSDSLGEVQVSGSCTGIGSVGGQTRSSLPADSPRHEILKPVRALGLFPLGNLPFSINRGQQGVVPLTLTLVNPGGPGAADAELRRLTITLDDGAGSDIVPTDLLSRVVVNEGLNIYLAKTALESTGSTVTLDLSEAVIISGEEPSTLSLRLDILSNTPVEDFRISIGDSNSLEAFDSVSGARVPVQLDSGAFPIQSSLGSLVGEAVGLNVTRSPPSRQTAGQGQKDVPLLSLLLDSEGTGPSSSEVEIGSLSISLVDTNGLALVNPHLYLERIRAANAYQTLAEATIAAPGDTVLTLLLSPSFKVPVGSPPLSLDLVGDLIESAQLGSFRIRLQDPDRFDARDGNTGSPIPVTYALPPLLGNTLTVQLPATEILFSAQPSLPPVVTLGAHNVLAFSGTVTNPGPPGTSDVLADSFYILLRDAARAPLAPATYIDRVYLWSDNQIIGEGVPSSQDFGIISIPATGFRLRAQQTLDMELTVDFEADAPLGSLEFVLTSDVIQAVDANLGTPVIFRGESPGDLPLGSGLARLEAPPDLITAGFTDRMPSMLAADGQALSVALVRLENPADPGFAPVGVGALTLHGADAGNRPLALGDAVEEILIYLGETLWGSSGPVALGDSSVTVSAPKPANLPAGGSANLELRLRLRGGSPVESLRLGFDAADVQVVADGGGVLALPVLPAAGSAFPFWTATGSLTALNLAQSYSNFPNPFAAGREPTTFVFALPTEAKVSLRLLNVRGETVATLLQNESLVAGLHQDLTWDGLNARGSTVHNGVYLAELVVEFADGKREHHLRKVAVVR